MLKIREICSLTILESKRKKNQGIGMATLISEIVVQNTFLVSSCFWLAAFLGFWWHLSLLCLYIACLMITLFCSNIWMIILLGKVVCYENHFHSQFYGPFQLHSMFHYSYLIPFLWLFMLYVLIFHLLKFLQFSLFLIS